MWCPFSSAFWWNVQGCCIHHVYYKYREIRWHQFGHLWGLIDSNSQENFSASYFVQKCCYCEHCHFGKKSKKTQTSRPVRCCFFTTGVIRNAYPTVPPSKIKPIHNINQLGTRTFSDTFSINTLYLFCSPPVCGLLPKYVPLLGPQLGQELLEVAVRLSSTTRDVSHHWIWKVCSNQGPPTTIAAFSPLSSVFLWRRSRRKRFDQWEKKHMFFSQRLPMLQWSIFWMCAVFPLTGMGSTLPKRGQLVLSS